VEDKDSASPLQEHWCANQKLLFSMKQPLLWIQIV